MRLPLAAMLVVLIALVAPAPVAAQDTLDEKIDKAIERGVKWVWSQQESNGKFSDRRSPRVSGSHRYPGAYEVLAVSVLAYAGESLQKPEMQKAIKALLEIEPEMTYTLSFRIIALAEVYDRADQRMKISLRRVLQRDAARLVSIQCASGAWSYRKATDERYWDFSNTQIAVLALGEATRCGVEIRRDVFAKVQKHYLELQRADGGWNYGHPSFAQHPSYGSMTAAGVASLFITQRALRAGQGCPCSSGRSRRRTDAGVDKAIDRGVAWLSKRFAADSHPGKQGIPSLYYWLYCCQRVGIATGRKYFGRHDWYRKGAEVVIAAQERDGSWGKFSETSLALLFLIKGRGPIILNKVEHKAKWTQHADDAANLARYIGRIKEQRIAWQVVHLNAPLEELHESPILYITAEAALKLSAKQKKTLRTFTDTGGTVFFEASCGNRAASSSIEALCKTVWPEWELETLAADHPLWTADLKVGDKRPALKGIDDGLRTFVLYSPGNISCYWHTRATSHYEHMFTTGSNLWAYATDRGPLRRAPRRRVVGVGKKYANERPAWKGSAALTVARLKHAGLWHVGRRYHPWRLLADDLAARTGLAVAEVDPVEPGAAIGKDVTAVYLAGRGKIDLPGKSIAALKTYLAAGGRLIAEATLGDATADTSLRAIIKAAGLTLRQVRADGTLLSGRFGAAGQGYRITGVGTTVALTAIGVSRKEPLLYEILSADSRVVGVYTPYDIMFSQTGCKAFGNRGYAAADARALTVNMAMHSLAR